MVVDTYTPQKAVGTWTHPKYGSHHHLDHFPLRAAERWHFCPNHIRIRHTDEPGGIAGLEKHVLQGVGKRSKGPGAVPLTGGRRDGARGSHRSDGHRPWQASGV